MKQFEINLAQPTEVEVGTLLKVVEVGGDRLVVEIAEDELFAQDEQAPPDIGLHVAEEMNLSERLGT